MRYVYYLLMIISFPLSFSGCCCPSWEYYGTGEWTKLIDGSEITHAIQHYLAYLRHEKHLRLEDSGVYYNHTINTVRMEFISQDVLEVREARMLLVDVVEGLLAELNKNSILAPQFIQFPLAPENLEIYINFESFHGLYVDPYYVGWMKLEHGTSFFYAFDLKVTNLNFWDFRIEPYFKSREFVIYEREAEKIFKEAVELANPPPLLTKERYIPPVKRVPRYFSAYEEPTIFD